MKFEELKQVIMEYQTIEIVSKFDYSNILYHGCALEAEKFYNCDVNLIYSAYDVEENEDILVIVLERGIE